MLRDLQEALVGFVRTFGAMTLFFIDAVRQTPWVLRNRFGLVVKQVHNAGALSMVIIMVSGIFVGGVLGLQRVHLLYPQITKR